MEDKIEYFNRYSDTHIPDKLNRWARIAVFKNIRIAWISKHINQGKEIYVATCHFPTMQNDTANESKVFYSLDEAKDFVSERWDFFLKKIVS